MRRTRHTSTTASAAETQNTSKCASDKACFVAVLLHSIPLGFPQFGQCFENVLSLLAQLSPFRLQVQPVFQPVIGLIIPTCLKRSRRRLGGALSSGVEGSWVYPIATRFCMYLQWLGVLAPPLGPACPAETARCLFPRFGDSDARCCPLQFLCCSRCHSRFRHAHVSRCRRYCQDRPANARG